MLLDANISPTALLGSKPSCAQPCWDAAIASANCDVGALKPFGDCICTNVPLLSALSTCIQKSCNFSDHITHINTIATLCDGYDKPSRKAELIVLAAAGMTLATIMGGLRCCSRVFTVRKFGWDDWTALIALILLLVMGSVGMIATGWGFGVHYWDSDLRFSQTIHQVFWAVEIGYLFNITIIKASIILLFGRIFETPKWQAFVKYSIIFFVVKDIAFLLPLVLQCKPITAIWDPEVHGACLNVSAIGFAGAGFSIAEDFILMIAPIPTLWSLQLPKAKRILLAVLFSIGSFATVTSLIRIKALNTFARTDDLTWDNVDVVIWTGIELVSALVCASIPPCWPLLSSSYAFMTSTVTRLFLGKPTLPHDHSHSELVMTENTNDKDLGDSVLRNQASCITTTNTLSQLEMGVGDMHHEDTPPRRCHRYGSYDSQSCQSP